MRRIGWAVLTLALAIVVALPASAYGVKNRRGSLDALTFARPELRVSVTATDAEAILKLVPNMTALDRFRAEHGTAWRFVVDERSGRVNLLDGGAIPFIPGEANALSPELFGTRGRSARDIPVEKVEALAREFLKQNYDVFLVDPDELVLDPLGSAPVWDSIYLLRFQWVPQGVPVEGGSVFFRINNGNLIQVATENLSTAPVDARPALSRETAWQILLGYLGETASDKDLLVDRGTLLLLPVTPQGYTADLYDPSAFGQMLGYRLTYRLAFTRPGVAGTWEGLVDAHTGELLRFVDTDRYGHIHGGIRPSDGLPPEEDRPFPYADTGLASPNNYSDGAGNFTGTTATSTLTGRYAHISDACGTISNATTTGDLDFLTDNAPGTDCVVPSGNPAGAGNTHSARTLFYNCTAINLKAQTFNPSNTWLTSNYVILHVNGASECNAGSSGLNIYFYQSNSSGCPSDPWTCCNNLGEIPGVAMHEWAHSYDTNDGSGGQAPPLETYADWTAIIQTHNSCTGAGFFQSGHGFNCDGYGDACTGCTGIRDCDFAKHSSNTPWTSANYNSVWGIPSDACAGGSYFGPCGKEDHCESGISTQALWDFVYRDLTDASASGPMYPNALDLTTAWMLEDRLWFTGVQTMTASYTCSSMTTNGCSGTVLYSVMRALDDDGDGTANGTPHAHAIYHALHRHLIDCNTYNDTSAQNQNQTSCPAITTPTLTAVAGSNQVVLNWTSGGASATRYFVYKNESGCDVAFNRIATVTAPTLTYTDNACVNGLTYYYRVQAATGNDSCVSASSGCATATPQPCAASVGLDRARYNCADSAAVTLLDSTPGSSPWTALAWSTSDATPRAVTLTNNPLGSATYTGAVATTTGAGGTGTVHVAHGDTLTVQFTDPDYCGAGSHAVTATASVDCVGPVISNVQATNVTGNSADLTWLTDEAADSYAVYDAATPPAALSASGAALVTGHTLHLTGLAECTPYFFYVRSTDAAGNASTDTAGGAYYTFTTGKNTQPTYTKVESPPLAIPDNNATGASSVLAVADTKTIQKVTVTVDSITHTYDGDITLYLIGPDATQVTLSARHGSSGDNYRSTVFDDAASTPIASGSAPFTGTFTPDSPLSAFIGKSALGNWTLKVVDSAGSDTGTIDSWSITFTYPAAACGPHGKYSSHARVADTCASGGTGNANGYWDPGEQVQFSLTLENDGTVPLTGVSATVTSTTPGVTLVDGSASYADIATGGTGVSLAPHFTVQLPPSLACGATVSFHVAVSANEGAWGSDFTQVVGHVVAGGDITVFSENFSAVTPPAFPAGWTTLNAGTGNNWLTTSSYSCAAAPGMYYPYSTTNAANAWAFTPGVALTAGVTYTLSFNQKVQSASFPETFEVKCGTAATAAGQTITVLASATYTNTTCTTRTPTFTVPTTGTYYLGFHCTSAADMYYLILDDISVTYPQAPSCTAYPCGPNVAYDTAYDPLTSLAQLCGDGDSTVEPGEQWQVTVRLKNTGSQSATGTQASLTVNSGSAAAATVAGNPASFGTLASGGTATASYQFSVDPGVVCNKNLIFDLTGIQSAEASYVSQVPAFTVQVGGNTAIKDETATQATTPLTASNATANSNLSPTLTVTSAATASLSYAGGYTPAGSLTLAIQPSTADTYVDENATTTNNGTATTMDVQRRASRNRRSLVQFSLAGIPAGSTITAATLELYCSTAPGTAQTLDVHHITAAWGETTVTWSTLPAYSAAADASLAAGTTTGWKTWTVTPVVQAWHAGTYTNNGLLVKCAAEGNPNNAYTFSTRENATTTNRPILRVTYTPPAGSWTANARVSLVSPSSTVTVLKAYGAADASPYDVLTYYTGPGTYQLRLEENLGGTASLTTGSLHVTQAATTHCTVASCNAPPPETAPGDLASTAQAWSDKTTHTWPANAQATGYRVLLGTPAQLPNLLNSSTDSCQKWTGAGTTCTLDDTPAAGSFYWYLVIGTNGAGEGSAGMATGGARVLNYTTGACP